MPTTKSATKALRQSTKHRSRNVRFSALYKESVKDLEHAIKATPAALPREDGLRLLSRIYSRVDTLVKKGILHPSNGSRKKARYAQIVKSACLKA